MMEQLEVGVCCMSESWDRDELGLVEIIQIDGYRIIKNVYSAQAKGVSLL
jgi:hypothetical protein